MNGPFQTAWREDVKSLAAYGKIEKNIFTLCGLVADIDGKTILKKTLSGPVEQSESIGVKLADSLISMGAKKILENIKSGNK